MRARSRRTVAEVLLAATAALASIGCKPTKEPVQRPTNDSTGGFANYAPVCPDHDVKAKFVADSMHLPAILRQVGAQLDIVEYHDCQRLVHYDQSQKALVYGPHVAIFRLDANQIGRPAALIWNLDARSGGQYPELHIRDEFSCVFVDGSGTDAKGRIVPVANPTTQSCAGVVSQPGQELQVVPYTAPGMSEPDYPDVARWDYDPVNRRNNIGLKCQAVWCELGLDDGKMHTSPVAGPDVVEPLPGHVKAKGRVTHVKGWYDEQVLAEGAGASLHVSTFAGTAYPDLDLDRYGTGTTPFPTKQWVPVAMVTLTAPSVQYATKLNLERGRNFVEVCNGTWDQCRAALPPGQGPPATMSCSTDWWAWIRSGRGHVAFRCEEYHPHVGIVVPGTVRWQWDDNDELLWHACGTACCTIKG